MLFIGMHYHIPGGVVVGHSRLSSQPLSTDPGLKSGISVRELITTFTKARRDGGVVGLNDLSFSRNFRKREQSHHVVLCMIKYS